jgi:hypothetical protein
MGSAPLMLPAQAGVRVGANSHRHLVVELHYKNRRLQKDIVDQSGVRLVMSKTLPGGQGVLVVGDPSLGFDRLPAGRGVVHRQGQCGGACTGQAIPQGESISVVASFLHMHAWGREIFSNVYSRDGEFRSGLGEINNWNVGTQGWSPLAKPVKVQGGDSIFTHCRYDTRNAPRDVNFKEGSLDEMCMHFLYYHPARTVKGKPWTLCGSLMGARRGAEAMGQDPDAFTQLLQSAAPYGEAVGFGMLCNTDPDLESETVDLGIGPVPLNRPDPRVWNNVTKAFEHADAFGQSASTVCRKLDDVATASPTTASPTAASSNTSLVVGLAVAGGVGLLLLAAAALVVYKKRQAAADKAATNEPPQSPQSAIARV